MTLPARALRGWLPVAVGVIVADLITKEWALSALRERDIEVFWTLQFNLSFNTGMAFSAGQNWGPVIGVAGMLIVVALLLSLRKQNTPLTNISVGLIVGGAIGNLIDRLFRDDGWFRGAVVDFIDLQWFPIFNIADMGITVGGGLLVLASFLAGRALDETATVDDVASTDVESPAEADSSVAADPPLDDQTSSSP